MVYPLWVVGGHPGAEGKYLVKLADNSEEWADFRNGPYGPSWQRCVGGNLYDWRAPIVAYKGPYRAPAGVPVGGHDAEEED